VTRWTQEDSIGGSIASPTTTNRYVYINGDPVNATDPSGRGILSCTGSIFDIVGGALLGVGAGLFGTVSGASGFTLFLAYVGVVAGYASIVFGTAAIASGSCT
jgi:hypothetical protein